MSAPRAHLLLASIHDVSPRFEGEVDRLSDQLRAHVGDRLAMLVVPNHWGEAPIVPGTAFATRLRGWADAGIEMFLHGFCHRDDGQHRRVADRFRASVLTASEGEFLGLSRADAANRIADADYDSPIGRSRPTGAPRPAPPRRGPAASIAQRLRNGLRN